MSSERRYYDDSYTTRFEGQVVALGEHAGKPALELATTWFYPESGGQLADHGAIGALKLVDVQVGHDERVWHVVEAPAGDAIPASGALACEIDWARRFDHMQQHTGQHILSAAFERLLDGPTLSSTLGAERSVIEVGLAEVDWRTVGRVEEAANRVLWEDRALKLHWTDDAHIGEFPLRKPPKVTGRIRVVEVPDWDWSACGGTHTRRTGEVGAIKIVGWERLRGNVRFAFLCGGRALRDHAWRTETLLEAAKRRSRSDRELVAHLERALDERDELKKRGRAHVRAPVPRVGGAVGRLRDDRARAVARGGAREGRFGCGPENDRARAAGRGARQGGRQPGHGDGGARRRRRRARGFRGGERSTREARGVGSEPASASHPHRREPCAPSLPWSRPC